MRILNRAQFLAMPPGTVYATGQPHAYGTWNVKTGNVNDDDWTFDTLDCGALDVQGSGDFHDKMEAMLKDHMVSFPVDFEQTMRDGSYSRLETYCILEPDDIRKLIMRLHQALIGK